MPLLTDSKAWFLPRRVLRGLALLVAGAAVIVWPEVLARIATDDGDINAPRLVFFLRAVSAVCGYFAVALAWLAHRPHGPWAALRRPALALVLLGTFLALLAPATFFGYARWVSRVDVLAAVAPEHPLAKAIAAATDREQQLAILAESLQKRPARLSLPPLAAWMVDSKAAKGRNELRLQGQLSTFPGVSLNWQPGQELDWSAIRSTMLDFALQRRDCFDDMLTSTDGHPSVAQLNWAAALMASWRQGNTYWPDWYPFVWNDDTTSNRVQMDMATMELRRAAHLTAKDEELAFSESLLQHAERLVEPARFNAQTNHGLMQIAALLDIAAHYPEFDRDRAWWNLGKQRLRTYVQRAVSPSGVSYELSPSYHHFITVKLLWIYLLLRQQGDPMAAELQETIASMLLFLQEIALPNGDLPKYGDTATVRLQLDHMPWALVPELLGKDAKDIGKTPPPFAAAGVRWRPGDSYFLIRMPNPTWDAHNGMMALLMLGAASQAHNHPDKLAFQLFAKGRTILSGPGFHTFADADRFKYFATPLEGTVSMDGGSQKIGDALLGFAIQSPGPPGLQPFAIQGISNLYQGVEHRRTLVSAGQAGHLLIIDELHSSQSHQYSLDFPLEPSLIAELSPGLAVVLPSRGAPPLCHFLVRRADAPAPLLAHMDGSVIRWQVAGKDAIFVSEVDCSARPATQPQAILAPDRVQWPAGKSAWQLPLPLREAGIVAPQPGTLVPQI